MKLTIFLQINGFKTKNSEFKFNVQKNIDKLYFFKMPYYGYLKMLKYLLNILIFLNVMFQLFFLLFHPNLKIPHLRQTIHKIHARHK